MSNFNLLRAVTHRLNHTPINELPHVAPFLAATIRNSAEAFKVKEGSNGGRIDDSGALLHKFKARVSSLLQDKSPHGRFTAVILVKATVEAGGRDILESCQPWLRGLLMILGKSDPIYSKKLCLLTITRIFSLTQRYPTLIREITTPLLPVFVTACMKLGGLAVSEGGNSIPDRPNPYLETVLQCILHLLPSHPSTFRPFAARLQRSLIKFVGGQSGPYYVTQLAHSLFVALHFCAPKNTAGDEWLKACKATVESIQSLADQVFRCVIEDWEPPDSLKRRKVVVRGGNEDPRGADDDPLGMPSWHGMFEGSKRAVCLLQLLGAFLARPTQSSVDLPLGLILDLVSRLLHIRSPTNIKGGQDSVRFNPEYIREEREDMLIILPEIHRATLRLLSRTADNFQLSTLSTSHPILDLCLWVFETEQYDEGIRLATYDLLCKLLRLMGPSMSKDGFKQVSKAIERCCEDSAPATFDAEMMGQLKAKLDTQSGINGHADAFLQDPSQRRSLGRPQHSELQRLSAILLCTILECVPSQSIPHSIRAQIDRAAIINDQKRTILASVLNVPPRTTGKHFTPSIMPFLARTSYDELEIEGLLRPRMPITCTEGGDMGFQQGLERETVGTIEDLEIHNGRIEDTSAKTEHEPLPGQNDLLDRLENSLGDVTASTPNPKIESGHNSSSQPADNEEISRSPIPESVQPMKRNFENIQAQDEVGASKRPRKNDESMKFASLTPLEQTMIDFDMAKPAVARPDAELLDELEASHANMDKGKTGVTGSSPMPERHDSPVGVNMKDDDESDFDMPPLYLKTSSEEDSDEEQDGDIGN